VSNMNRELQILVSAAKEVASLQATLDQLNETIVNAGTNAGLLADICYVCREVSNTIDEMRKQIDRTKESAAKDCCTLLTMFNQRNIQTNLCTATPKPKMQFRYPSKKREEGWAEFIEKLLEDNQVVIANELVRPHFPGIQEYLATFVEKGKPLPFGISLASFFGSVPDMTIRKKTNLF